MLLSTATAFATWSVEYFIIHKYYRRISSGCQTKTSLARLKTAQIHDAVFGDAAGRRNRKANVRIRQRGSAVVLKLPFLPLLPPQFPAPGFEELT